MDALLRGRGPSARRRPVMSDDAEATNTAHVCSHSYMKPAARNRVFLTILGVANRPPAAQGALAMRLSCCPGDALSLSCRVLKSWMAFLFW
ncbi:hypothetical protein EYF80_001943 [Liparis tanakae]|uniref:Uncharacterized protein n=1 Tax=Liparis tanakae TaxID=230148 RepID=A0A4Z2JCP2_9TELE|nr:hypothetical protein EYF80_001943 [Liparis tanakae]